MILRAGMQWWYWARQSATLAFICLKFLLRPVILLPFRSSLRWGRTYCHTTGIWYEWINGGTMASSLVFFIGHPTRPWLMTNCGSQLGTTGSSCECKRWQVVRCSNLLGDVRATTPKNSRRMPHHRWSLPFNKNLHALTPAYQSLALMNTLSTVIYLTTVCII